MTSFVPAISYHPPKKPFTVPIGLGSFSASFHFPFLIDMYPVLHEPPFSVSRFSFLFTF